VWGHRAVSNRLVEQFCHKVVELSDAAAIDGGNIDNGDWAGGFENRLLRLAVTDHGRQRVIGVEVAIDQQILTSSHRAFQGRGPDGDPQRRQERFY